MDRALLLRALAACTWNLTQAAFAQVTSGSPAPPAAAPANVLVSVQPDPTYIEVGEQQQLNFEFIVENLSSDTLRLSSVEMAIFDKAGKLVLRRDVTGAGASPGLLTIMPDRAFQPGAKGLFYNPFHQLALDIPLYKMRYRITFDRGGGKEPLEREIILTPRAWNPVAKLVLPSSKRLWVKHGHDFLSHHRRWNPYHPIAESFGATAIFARYGLDLLVVDQDGNPRKGLTNSNDDYHGWGAELRAPAAGTVVAAYDDDPDDDRSTGKSAFDPERLPKEPLHFYGNYVIIDHGNREFSVLGHLQQNSVPVRVGEKVRRGQFVGRLGTSGSAEFEPHLHYELRTGAGMNAEGLPAYFTDFSLLRGARRQPVRSGPINSGDIVLSDR
ncbi:MAG TPA: M23 family metallopeptidase [Allosphingosinicella sp.]|uniref:M23 family metallopeptidase n=1 Tax=Allosphingosinicella sp. TaxID=2823234 RepID=UPI002ED872B6